MTTQAKLSQPQAGRTWLPALAWLRSYDRSWLRPDVIAGLTLWGLLAPETMAYAGIAGLPPQAGLYTLLASLLIYALLGTARHLSVGPTSATAALLAGVVTATLAGTAVAEAIDPALYQSYATALVLVVGALFLVAGLARLGFVTQFLSKPVMDGFVTGLALFVAVGQLNKLFGVEKGEGNTVEKFLHVLGELPQANWVTFAVGASALALLFLLPRLSKKIPAGLVVLFGYIALSAVLALNATYGVEVVGTLPQGLPSLALPSVPASAWISMILPAIGIVLVAYSEALGVAREFAEKHGYEVNPDQELNAHGVTNLVSGLFGGMLAAGGMSGSAVKEGAGARSQVANLVAWVAVVVTVLLLTPLFTSLPEAVLAALIIHAVWHIIAARKLRRIRLVSRVEFGLGALTLAGVLLLDVLPGMIIGLLASLLLVIYHSSRPHISSLGRTPDAEGIYSDLTRHPENAPVPGVLIVRLDAPMYYANALTVRDSVKALVTQGGAALHTVVLDAEGQYQLDLTSVEVLAGLVKELRGGGLAVYAAEVHTPVAEFARKTGLYNLFGEKRIFATVEAAVRYAEANPTVASATVHAEP